MVHEGGWQFVRADETDEVMVLPPVPDHVGRAPGAGRARARVTGACLRRLRDHAGSIHSGRHPSASASISAAPA